MRYYDLVIKNSDGSTYKEWTTHPNGNYDPGALDVEFDLNVYYGHVAGGEMNTITVWGVSLTDLRQSSDFAGKNFYLYGGMKKGLPLANPAQAGLLLQGQIWQSFGNWAGTDMTITFVVTGTMPDGPDTNLNFSGTWKAGQPLSTAIAQTLTNALPNAKQNIRISSNLVLSHDETWTYSTFGAFASQIQGMTVGTLSANYPGVTMCYAGGAITVSDQTTLPNAVQIVFTDLVGQPAWIGPNIMQVTTILRADIGVGDVIKMPQGLFNAPGAVTTTSASAPSQEKYKTTFSGNFIITEMRAIGSLRDPSGLAWISMFNCTPVVTS